MASTGLVKPVLRAGVGRWLRNNRPPSSNANKHENWLSDENIAAFMATVDAPEAILV